MSKGKVHNIGTKNKQRKRCIKKEMKEGEKENNMKRTRIEEKGITLVALVITIVILIILATVTINVALGEGGLIKRGELATSETANSMKYEEETFTNLETYINAVLGGGEANPPVPEEWDTEKVTPVFSQDKQWVPVPNGFVASEAEGENEVNKGFVIYQGTDPVNDGNVDNEQERRNQFVWIPVDEESLNDMYQVANATLSQSSHGEGATTTSVYSKSRRNTLGGVPGSTSYREPDILPNSGGDASTNEGEGINLITSVFGITGDNASVMKQWAEMLVNEYEAVYESIKKYDGFYIGRYELTGNTTTPTVQRNKVVLVNQNWYALKKACNEIVNTNEVQSIMIYGNMWDETMQWLVDTGAKKESEVYVNSSTWGNYNDSSGNAAILGAGSPQNSGYSDYWCANNVYDLAGNYGDGTQEAYDPLTFELLEGEFTPFPVTASLPQVVTSAATPLRAFPTATILLAQLCTSSKIASASMARAIS